MAESIFMRVHRVLSGSVEDAVDRMEQAGGESVMREAIREVDWAIDAVHGDREAAAARRLQAVRQQKMLRERLDQLTEKAKFCVAEGRDDLAEAALSRQIDFEAQAAELDRVQAASLEEEGKLDESLTALKSRKAQMDEALAAYTVSRREAAVGGDGPNRTRRDIDGNVARAEQAFDRAMTGAGGVTFTRSDAETIQRVAEIDGMQKSANVKDRLAQLKQQAA